MLPLQLVGIKGDEECVIDSFKLIRLSFVYLRGVHCCSEIKPSAEDCIDTCQLLEFNIPQVSVSPSVQDIIIYEDLIVAHLRVYEVAILNLYFDALSIDWMHFDVRC